MSIKSFNCVWQEDTLQKLDNALDELCGPLKVDTDKEILELQRQLKVGIK